MTCKAVELLEWDNGEVVYGRALPRLLSYNSSTARLEVVDHALRQQDSILQSLWNRLLQADDPQFRPQAVIDSCLHLGLQRVFGALGGIVYSQGFMGT